MKTLTFTNYYSQEQTFSVGDKVWHCDDSGNICRATITSIVEPDALELAFDDGDEGTEQTASCWLAAPIQQTVASVKSILAKINALPKPGKATVDAFAHNGDQNMWTDESIQKAIDSGRLQIRLDLTWPHTHGIEDENARFDAFSSIVFAVKHLPRVAAVSENGTIDGDGYRGEAFLVHLR